MTLSCFRLSRQRRVFVRPVHRLVAPLLACAIWLANAAIAGSSPDPLALMRESDKRHRLASERTRLAMVLQEKGGPERARSLELVVGQELKKKSGDKQWIRFDAPGDIKGTQLLTVESDDGSAQQWLYLPAFKKSRRVGAAELGDRFAGTDFFYEDLKHRVVDDYSYKLLGSESIDGVDCWHIESVPQAPKAKAESPYGKTEIWLRKDVQYIVRTRYFDRQAKPLKELRAQNLVKVAGPVWRADQLTMTDIQRNHRTVLKVQAREVNVVLPASTFNPHSLTGS